MQDMRECKNIPFSARGVSEHGAPVPSEQLREGHGPQGGRRGRARAAAVGRPHGVPHVLHLHVRRSVAFRHWRHRCLKNNSTVMAMDRDETYKSHTYKHRGVGIRGSDKYLIANFCTVAKISGEHLFYIRLTP